MGQEEGLLALIEIGSNSEYKLESETSTSISPLPLYMSFLPTPPPLSSLPSLISLSSLQHEPILPNQLRASSSITAEIACSIAGTNLSPVSSTERESNLWSRGSVMIQCSKCLSKELTLVLSDTRELNRVSSTK